MKNTTFRKKALLSSVAMLLVALVALGSATFAWFTSNPDSNASGLSMKTTASTGLVTRTETDEEWTHASFFNAEAVVGAKPADRKFAAGTDIFDLTPVSQDQTNGNLWTIAAGDASAFTADSKATKMDPATASSDGTGDAYKENVYFRLSDGSNATEAASKKVYITGVTITAHADATMENAIRVAITNGDGKVLGTYALDTAGANGTLTTASKTPGSFDPALAKTATNLEVDTGVTGLSATATDLSKYVTVYVYLDGQDSICYSDAVGTYNAAQIITGVKVDFTLK